MKHVFLLAAAVLLTACTPAGPTTAPLTLTPPPTTLPTTGVTGPDPLYTDLCKTANPTLAELAVALENYKPGDDTTVLERMLDTTSGALLFIEDTNYDTARITGAALTAITGVSLAITNEEDISGLTGPAAQAVRALIARVCG